MSEREHGSRRQYRRFVRERGIFGNRPPPPATGPAPAAAPAAAAAGGSGDPARRVTLREFRKRGYLGRYAETFRGMRGQVVCIMAISAVTSALNMAFPWASKILIDDVLPLRDAHFLFVSCGLLLAIGLSQVAISFVGDFVRQRLAGNYIIAMKRRMMRHIQRLPLYRIQELKVGAIVTRVQQDAENMGGLLSSAVLTPFEAVLMFTLGMGSMFALNWRVTLSCIVFSVLVLIVAYVTFTVLRPFQKILREELAAIGGRLTEVFNGMQVVKVFRRESHESREFARSAHLLWRKQLHVGVANMVIHRCIWGLYWLITVTIWAYGGYQTIRGAMKVGELVAFGSFTHWIFSPIFMFMHSFSQLQSNAASAERVFDILDEPRGMPDRPDARPIARIERGLAFENVSFTYPNGTRALDNVSFSVPRGQVVALVGPSGAGKSTLINLVMRFFDPSEGAVLLDGMDIRDLQLQPYRGLMSLVPQEVFLFDGTIRDNIAYGRPGAPAEAVEEAARVAHCHEFVSRLDRQYETVIGERGVRLSMGQRQRIALARAILLDPQILILDEATSSLDAESEHLIQDALRQIFRNRTTLVIAHRLSTVIDAHRIVVVDKGRIAEEGRHEELLAREGRYHQLYSRQMQRIERQKEILDWNEENGATGAPGEVKA